ncbi:hypothetical protein CBP36_16060 [Acidovorax carolinensis]|uniref:Uncharacterized protein n=1 Tax=Acidovorax carolinensis TaxID=553814 RepID=A0A240UF58_9BURK|nr:hypothetical protein CBP35_02860 [Acidovorax carolinensis]ART60131.1 hypothetical protein CBP36_16060 [Acidovorax carolinensis]
MGRRNYRKRRIGPAEIGFQKRRKNAASLALIGRGWLYSGEVCVDDIGNTLHIVGDAGLPVEPDQELLIVKYR